MRAGSWGCNVNRARRNLPVVDPLAHSAGMRRTLLFLLPVLISLTPLADANPWLTDSRKAFLEEETQRNRMQTITVEVRDSQGKPLADAEVEFVFRRHAFLFGTAIKRQAFGEEESDERYLATVLELFNTVTMGNAMKWAKFEEPGDRELLSRALDWIEQNGLRLRGHTMIWQTTKYKPVFPLDVHAAIKEGGEEARAYVANRALEHVRRIGSFFRGRVVEWDVLNEQPHEHLITDFLDPDTPPERAPVQLAWFKAARESDPLARLMTNDYGILVERNHDKKVLEQTEFLLESGAPLDGVGMQGHFWDGNKTPIAEEIWERFDLFAGLGVKIGITEFDMYGPNWQRDPEKSIDENKAMFFESLLRTTFAHPAANGFVMWGFWDGRHWKNDAPLFYEDWRPKPAFEVYKRLVLEEWTSDATLETDADGKASAELYHGTYDVTIRAEGQSWTFTEEVAPGIDVLHYAMKPEGEKQAGQDDLIP